MHHAQAQARLLWPPGAPALVVVVLVVLAAPAAMAIGGLPCSGVLLLALRLRRAGQVVRQGLTELGLLLLIGLLLLLLVTARGSHGVGVLVLAAAELRGPSQLVLLLLLLLGVPLPPAPTVGLCGRRCREPRARLR